MFEKSIHKLLLYFFGFTVTFKFSFLLLLCVQAVVLANRVATQ